MPPYAYDLPTLTQHIELLDTTIAEFETRRDSVATTAATVLSHYSGSAASAFEDFHAGWRTKIDEQIEALKAHRTFVVTARDNDAEAQRKNAEMFGRGRR